MSDANVAHCDVRRFRLTGLEADGSTGRRVDGSIVTVRDAKILAAIGYAPPGRATKAAGLRREG